MNRVIDQMAKAEGDVERQLRKYIPEIIKECMAFAYLGKTFTFDISDLSDRVNQKLVALSDAILEDIESRAQKVIRYAEEEEDEDDILLYINRTIGEENLVQRLDKHCSTLRYFLEGWIAIGIVNKIKEHELTNIILSHIDNPLSSALWQDALNAGYLSNAIRSGLYQYGKGNQKNVLSALREIERYSINEAFQYGCILKYGKMGAIGYRTYRQSSYPCDHCDELTMRVWPLDTMVLPAHPRCVCRSEPVFADESLLDTIPATRLKGTPLASAKASQKNTSWDVRSVGRGIVSIHNEVNQSDSDFADILSIANFFANEGKIVTITPKKAYGSKFDYDEIYGSLKGTPFYGKCPDINIDGFWYEHEGFVTSNSKNAFRNMMRHGLAQSNRIIINDPGLTERYIKKSIYKRIEQDGQDIVEVWLKRNNELISLYKKQEE